MDWGMAQIGRGPVDDSSDGDGRHVTADVAATAAYWFVDADSPTDRTGPGSRRSRLRSAAPQRRRST